MRRKRKLNVLINNAAVMLSSRDLAPRHTTDGLEVTMATNHLGRFGQPPSVFDCVYVLCTASLLFVWLSISVALILATCKQQQHM